MFIESSRYFQLRTVEAPARNGRTVTAIALRRLPYVAGAPVVVKGNDRLDVMAQRRYKDGARFWHIADANTELQANDLVEAAPPDNPLVAEAARIILVPEK